ncbi:ribonuclease domain-containing protein [Falsarthrobacter nasiphocae]|uniref:Ribonuclease T1 n=1 Tax=Falsarthrobacter nasiphocae TaxID=189863 RepID=A0AAE3YGW6_9MICC|nr:ribonuclease domain-containing protein [Falsarthrobacter nasiphocae]MDR6891761.1 ribonuclease T1 [Falsarthrobacter nasiphocae]
MNARMEPSGGVLSVSASGGGRGRPARLRLLGAGLAAAALFLSGCGVGGASSSSPSPSASVRGAEPKRSGAASSGSTTAPAGMDTVKESELPAEGRRVLTAIRKGGPFAYERDGVVFGNYEKLLPGKKRGYYREYTVPTPGSSSRGARRIVVGGGAEKYYTSDHYETFKFIEEGQ